MTDYTHTVSPDSPSKRRRLRPILIAAALTVILAGGGFLAGMLLSHDSALPEAALSPSAVLVQLDELAACRQLLPLLGDASKQILAVADHPDGSTVNWGNLGDTAKALQDARRVVPPSMQSDVDMQIDGLRQLLNASPHLELANFRDSGLRLLTTCERYAN